MLRTLKMKRSKRLFTLLEVMVAIALLLLASSWMGLKIHQGICKKRFQSDLERIEARCLMIQKLAVAMQADWKGVLKKKGVQWVFEATCDEPRAKKFSSLKLESPLQLFFEAKESDEVSFDFFSNGRVLPEGTFLFAYRGETVRWETSQFFQREEGEKAGPTRPES